MNRHGTFEHPPARCPYCGTTADAATPHPGTSHVGKLSAGDVLACVACASVSRCEKVTRIGRPILRRLTLAEKRELLADPAVAATQAAILRMSREMGHDLKPTRSEAAPAVRRTKH